jgi:putative oxidoreductase
MRPIAWLASKKDFAPVLIRLIVGVILIEGTADNVFSWQRMIEFRKFLDARGFPFPLPGAIVSAYCQFICGFLILLGVGTRIAAALMAINFIFAIVIAHLDGGFAPARLALLVLFCSLSLVFSGPGRLAISQKT